MSDTTSNGDEGHQSAKGRRNELFAVIVLGTAALLTAVSAFKAALSDGEALQGYSEATQKLSDANQQYGESTQIFALDQGLFVQYAVADSQDNEAVKVYIRDQLMGEELKAAVAWMESTPDALTPFDDRPDNPYSIPAIESAEAFQTESEDKHKEATKADEQGDKVELSNVFFAATLFFAGIATTFRRDDLQLYMVGVGIIVLVGGAVLLVTAFA